MYISQITKKKKRLKSWGEKNHYFPLLTSLDLIGVTINNNLIRVALYCLLHLCNAKQLMLMMLVLIVVLVLILIVVLVLVLIVILIFVLCNNTAFANNLIDIQALLNLNEWRIENVINGVAQIRSSVFKGVILVHLITINYCYVKALLFSGLLRMSRRIFNIQETGDISLPAKRLRKLNKSVKRVLTINIGLLWEFLVILEYANGNWTTVGLLPSLIKCGSRCWSRNYGKKGNQEEDQVGFAHF